MESGNQLISNFISSAEVAHIYNFVYMYEGISHMFLFKKRGEIEQISVCRSCHTVQKAVFYTMHSRLSNKFWEELMAPNFCSNVQAYTVKVHMQELQINSLYSLLRKQFQGSRQEYLSQICLQESIYSEHYSKYNTKIKRKVLIYGQKKTRK